MLKILIKITISFSNVRLSNSPWKQTVMVKKDVEIRKITLHFHKTLTLGVFPTTLTLGMSSYNVNV